MTAAPKPDLHALLDEYLRRAATEEPIELIDGEIVSKVAPQTIHGATQVKLGALLDGLNRRTGGPRGPGGWWIVSEVEVLYPKTTEVYRHDLMGFRRDLHAAAPSMWPVDVRPDWACEILSPSNARYDVVKKMRTLHKHGVPHYWVVDPAQRTLTVHRYDERAYLRILDAGPGEVVRAEPFDAIELSIDELFETE